MLTFAHYMLSIYMQRLLCSHVHLFGMWSNPTLDELAVPSHGCKALIGQSLSDWVNHNCQHFIIPSFSPSFSILLTRTQPTSLLIYREQSLLQVHIAHSGSLVTRRTPICLPLFLTPLYSASFSSCSLLSPFNRWAIIWL